MGEKRVFQSPIKLLHIWKWRTTVYIFLRSLPEAALKDGASSTPVTVGLASIFNVASFSHRQAAVDAS